MKIIILPLLLLLTSQDAVVWEKEAWHFFLHVIYTLKLLLGGMWKAVVKQWSTPQGTSIPIQVIGER
jgi:hypothetical protein